MVVTVVQTITAKSITERGTAASSMTMTPEFGPAPYTPGLPYSEQLVSDPWELNVAMLKLLKQRHSGLTA